MSTVVLVLLGLLTTALGSLWAADFRGIVTRLHRRQLAERAGLPPHLRRAAPPPTAPAAQRALGALLALVGLTLLLTGLHTLTS
ncbi:hypothetical protein ACIRST_24765 [Kitasatospora sp. NPDC101447]|uniref:hypothetical protein n=1 Tax=Kitasatospora sp. NPDC101447 TaxID=3364102 RepID=UPI003818E47D